MRGISFATTNAAGPLDSITEARLEVNVPGADLPPQVQSALLQFHARAAIENISMHEGLPGHYLQYPHARESPSKVRKAFWSGTTGEGWAHYCEQAMLEQNYREPDARRAEAFYLRAAMHRAARMVIDVALNTGAMSALEASKFMEENAFLAPEAAQIEVRRALAWPATLYSYTYGKLAILRLRSRVQAMQKEQFELARFHDRLLSIGAVPMRYLAHAAFDLDQL